MLAIEFVELAIVGRLVLRAVPPVPVAAFGDQDLFKRQSSLRFADAIFVLFVKVTGVEEVVPGAIVFRRADPHVEVGVDPGAGHERRERRNVLLALDRFGYGDGFHAGSRFAARRKSGGEIHGRTAGNIPTHFRRRE